MTQPQAPLVSTVELHTNNTTPVNETPDTTTSSPSDKGAQIDALLQASLAADEENPDGGYGLVVLFGCMVIAWWYISIAYTWGFFQIALVQQRHMSTSTLAFVGSLCPSFIASLAIPNAKLVRALGPRVTALIGMFVMGVGCILASFTTENVGGLFATFGFLCGVGNSMLFMVINVTPSQWFSKKRGLANGLIYAAGGLGGAVMSFALDALIKGLGIPWAFRVQGLAMLATGLPAAHLLQTRYPIPPTKMVEWSMFRDARFVFLFAAGAVTTFPLYVPPFFLPLYADALSLSSNAGVCLVAGFNFASAVGRLGCGYAGDVLGSVNALLLAVTLNALTVLIIWPLSDTLGPLIPFVILNGMANGGFFAIMPTIISSIFGSARLSVAMGMIVTGWFGGYLLGPPIAGYILEATGDETSIGTYRPAIFFAGAMAAASVILVGAIRLLVDRELRKKV